METEFCTIDPGWSSDYQLKAELLANQLGFRICGFPNAAGNPCRMRPLKGGVRCFQHQGKKAPTHHTDPAIAGGNLLVGSRELAKSGEIFNLRPAIAAAKWLLNREEEAFQDYYRQCEELKSDRVEPARKRQIVRRLFPLLEKTNQSYVMKEMEDGKTSETLMDWHIGWLYRRLEDGRKTIEYQVNNLATITKRAAETETITKDLISRTDADAVLMAMATGYANAVREYLSPEKAEELLQSIEASINRQIRPLQDKKIVNEPEEVEGPKAGHTQKISMKPVKSKKERRPGISQPKRRSGKSKIKKKKREPETNPNNVLTGVKKRGRGRPRKNPQL